MLTGVVTATACQPGISATSASDLKRPRQVGDRCMRACTTPPSPHPLLHPPPLPSCSLLPSLHRLRTSTRALQPSSKKGTGPKLVSEWSTQCTCTVKWEVVDSPSEYAPEFRLRPGAAPHSLPHPPLPTLPFPRRARAAAEWRREATGRLRKGHRQEPGHSCPRRSVNGGGYDISPPTLFLPSDLDSVTEQHIRYHPLTCIHTLLPP